MDPPLTHLEALISAIILLFHWTKSMFVQPGYAQLGRYVAVCLKIAAGESWYVVQDQWLHAKIWEKSYIKTNINVL